MVMKIYPISEEIYFKDWTSDLYSYILYPIGQALWNRDQIYIVIGICLISEEIEHIDRTSDRTSDPLLCLIGQALGNRDWIYIVIDICLISEKI